MVLEKFLLDLVMLLFSSLQTTFLYSHFNVIIFGFLFFFSHCWIFGLGSNMQLQNMEPSAFSYSSIDEFGADSSLFFESKGALDSKCVGPIYDRSKIYELVQHFRQRFVFPVVDAIEINNDNQELLLLENVFSAEELRTINDELALINVFHFAARVTGGFKIYIDLPGTDTHRIDEASLNTLLSLRRKFDKIQIERPSILFLLLFGKAKDPVSSIFGENRCKAFAQNKVFL